MPSVKRTGVKAVEKKTGFESYDGPEPHKRGMYRSRVKQLRFKEFKSGAQGFSILTECEAAKGDPKDHAQFDGYGIWSNLVFGDAEGSLARESNFYAALGLKDDPTILFEDGDITKGVDIKSLGGKSLEAIKKLIVNVDIKMSKYEGEDRPEVDGIYKISESATPTPRAAAPVDEEEEEDESDLMEEDESEEEEAEEEEGLEERTAELEEASLADLRNLAKEYEIKTVGLKKPQLIEAILAEEFPADGAAALEDDEEEEEDDEEVEEADEEEEDEDDSRATREAELTDLDRAELKKIIKGHQPDFKVLTRTTEAELVEAILAAEFDGETPF